MKKIINIVLLVTVVYPLSAQLTITAGSQFSMGGNAQLTLVNTDLVNNGSLSAGNGTVFFTGNAISRITGGQNTTLYDLNIGKTAGSVQLQVPIVVSHQVIFSSGLLDLNANDLSLGANAVLNGEQEFSHIIGSNGGTVSISTNLNNPSGANPGNLGLLVTSSQNLGNTLIKRGHQVQVNTSGNGSSVLRYYDITPANNNALNATLRFTYLNAELNGLDENTLLQWEKQTPQDWKSLGFDARNTSSNYVDKTGVASFGRFTLSSVNNALPVRFISFNAQCNGTAVLLTWTTALEQNSHNYLVQKSTDGAGWLTIGNIQAAGNAVTENDYSFSDINAADNSYYRLAEYDMDGNVQFTKILHASCNSPQLFRTWPDPVTDMLFINLPSAVSTATSIQLYDSKGALVKKQMARLLPGNNVISMDVKQFSAGIYFLHIINSNGVMHVQQLIKN